jgi:pimeloyl-ACP methyl ester carboxylesterase
VLAVLDALKIERPVLVGHSIAGEELSSVGSRHPERVGGLIYLDAVYGYAYYDQSVGYLPVDVAEVQKKLTRLINVLGDPQIAKELLQNDLPTLERDLRGILQPQPPKPPNPTRDDLASFQALSVWITRIQGIAFPESELRTTMRVSADGRPSGAKTPPSIPPAIMNGGLKYTQIRVPVLAICAVPHNVGPFLDSDPAARTAAKALDTDTVEPQLKAFERGVPTAHVVRLAHANHYVFISDEAAVLREMGAFIKDLAQ